MATIEIKEIEFNDKINETKGIQIVNFHGTWCGPCRMLAPVLEDISNNYDVFKIDIDNNKGLSNKMEIQNIPATFIYKNGEMKEKIVGYFTKEVLNNKIKEIK